MHLMVFTKFLKCGKNERHIFSLTISERERSHVPPENNIWLYYYKLILLWAENKRQSYVPTLYCPVNVLKPGS